MKRKFVIEKIHMIMNRYIYWKKTKKKKKETLDLCFSEK